MRTFAIVMLILGVLFLVSQILIKRSTNKTEGHSYTLVEDYGEFEVRKYEPALFSYTVMASDSYKNVSGKGFRRLAGYIFGDNDKNQKIAMTTPVAMDMSDSITMKFKVPSDLWIWRICRSPIIAPCDLPKKRRKLSLPFGLAESQPTNRIAKYTDKLKKALDDQGIGLYG